MNKSILKVISEMNDISDNYEILVKLVNYVMDNKLVIEKDNDIQKSIRLIIANHNMSTSGDYLNTLITYCYNRINILDGKM